MGELFLKKIMTLFDPFRLEKGLSSSPSVAIHISVSTREHMDKTYSTSSTLFMSVEHLALSTVLIINVE